MSLFVHRAQQKAIIMTPSPLPFRPLLHITRHPATRTIYTQPASKNSVLPAEKAFEQPQLTYQSVAAAAPLAATRVFPETKINALGRVPTSSLIASLLASSVGFLPKPLLTALIRFTKKRSQWIESLPPLRRLAKKIFYDTFCIGATRTEIAAQVAELRSVGVRGVILAFGREAKDVKGAGAAPEAALTREEPGLKAFVEFNKDTIDKLRAGDYLAVRCTGAGKATLRVMDSFAASTRHLGQDAERWKQTNPELDVFYDALYEVCAASHARGIKVLIDAEDTERQVAIDAVALRLMKTFNTGKHATILTTYQMYLKAGVEKLKLQLQHSIDNNYTLGVKMVRGAFISTEPNRQLVHATKQDTDNMYDEAVRLLINTHGTGGTTEGQEAAVTAASSEHKDNRWTADVMLATHNSHSAREALRLYRKLIEAGGNKFAPGTGLQSLTFAQLKGMADELTFELISEIDKIPAQVDQNQPGVTRHHDDGEEAGRYPTIGVYKYSVWGTFQECLLYMVRRAEENKDALARSKSTCQILTRELFRRMSPFGASVK